ncbi:kinase-like protein, partial [Rickenella mellea]
NFDFLHVLGTGRFAKVYLARREADSKLYAVKSVRKRAVLDEYCTPHVRSEQACLKMVTELLAPFLPRLHWSFQDEERLYMAMDFYPGGDLLTHLTRDGYFNTERCVFYASEIAEAVSYLHSLGIVHRDLKPDNIMIADDGHIVLTDFGLAKMLFFSDEEIPKTGSCCGTREYQAPEMLLGWSYDFSVDCWGFGLLLYTMHYGRVSFIIRAMRLMVHVLLSTRS